MTLTITAAQRDALYDQIVDRLSGIGDIELAIQLENYDLAERLSREYSDDLRLLLEDLGFGEGDGQAVELTVSPQVLRRVLPRMRDLAKDLAASQEPEWAEASQMKRRNQLVTEACEAVLTSLEGTGTHGR